MFVYKVEHSVGITNGMTDPFMALKFMFCVTNNSQRDSERERLDENQRGKLEARNVLRGFHTTRECRGPLWRTPVIADSAWFMSLDVILRADVTVYLCAITGFRILRCKTVFSLSGCSLSPVMSSATSRLHSGRRSALQSGLRPAPRHAVYLKSSGKSEEGLREQQ